MYQERVLPRRHYISGAAWVLLGLAIGLHLPDIDNRLGWLAPFWLLLHRSILTHGPAIPLLLLWQVRKRGGAAPTLGPFAVGLSLALAVHLCFDFFPRDWIGFALIHIPVYGWTSALFSQAWIIFSIVTCLYAGFRLTKGITEVALGVGSLIVSFIISAAENGHPIISAFMLLTSATVIAIVMSRRK